ncbi:hypothetical protein OH76DRAFT_1451820 [Lentinus brumalis]|uniref:Transmembrane protein n=1 Tax=Lentinus brumalis TaxID=2498619 RepID=A0A371DW58_9APHY|nr:hypothetical protein OH76DRAFT_1451820 [Polyporus brumalis]
MDFLVSSKSAYPPTSEPSRAKNTSSKKGKTRKTVTPSNLVEKKSSGDSDEHKSSTTAKDKPKATAKSKADKTTEVDAKAVPVPAPDTGLSSTHPVSIHTGILPVIPTATPTTLTVPPHTYGSGFSTLPPFSALATSTLLAKSSTSTGTPDGTSRALGESQEGRAKGQASKHIPVVVIVLVAIGVAFLLLGCLIFFWRVQNRPRKRSCPTPSLPIWQEPFTDQELKGDEESLFGGQERSSAVARPNSNGLYPWIQYTPKPSDALAALSPVQPADFPVPPPAFRSEKAQVAQSVMAPVRVPLPVNNAPANPALQQMQSALTRAANRVSTLSMSIYPTSPQSANTNTGIGMAIGCASPLTADGTPVLQRKPSRDRVSKSRKSYRHSLAATEYLDIYGGAQVTSPNPTSGSAPTSAAPIKSALRKSTSIHANAQGRARVKAGYTPGSAPLRIATLRRAGDRTSMVGQCEQDMQHMLPPLSPALKTDARRERDARALASALGLASPSPHDHYLQASPVPTIAPDDSITLAGDRARNKYGAHSRAHSEAMSPGTEASARLGNLMLAEFTSMASLPSARMVAGVPPSGSKARVVPRKNVNANAGISRGDDRPPRVPSPPPLPSLAQMAMAHTNQEEYDDYRSPTYSIYGLYEAERKSRMQAGERGF